MTMISLNLQYNHVQRFIQIKKQAAMMAQKPISRSGTGSISASGFLPAQVCKLVLSSTTNSNEVAPNAVIQLNKNNNRNEEQATTEVRNFKNLIGPYEIGHAQSRRSIQTVKMKRSGRFSSALLNRLLLTDKTIYCIESRRAIHFGP